MSVGIVSFPHWQIQSQSTKWTSFKSSWKRWLYVLSSPPTKEQMERVKEESRRKSEELEFLRNSMQRSIPSSEPLYARNASRGETLYHQGFQELGETPAVSRPVDDYVMDFSKPAGYQPPERTSAPLRQSPETAPVAQPVVVETPPSLPNQLPPRRNVQRSHDVIQRPLPSPSEMAPSKPSVPSGPVGVRRASETRLMWILRFVDRNQLCWRSCERARGSV